MIAVTGASGYIGQATVRALARAGPVLALGRSVPAVAGVAGVRAVATGTAPPLPEWFAGCGTVVHLAGRAHTTVAREGARDLFDEANRELALQTAFAAGAAGVRRFVFVSSIGVHGNWSPEILRGDSAVAPDAAYARSKWAAEQALKAFCAGPGMELLIVRPPMVYGAGCPGNFPRLVRLVKSGAPLPFAAVEACRSFIHVDNLASFLAACAARPMPPVHSLAVGDGSDWALPELIRGIAQGLGVPPRLFRVPPALLRAGGLLVGRRRELESLTLPMRIDSGPAWGALRWTPELQPDEALRRSAASYRDR